MTPIRRLRWLPLLLAIPLLGGCAVVGGSSYRAMVVPPPGVLFADISGPLMVPSLPLEPGALEDAEVFVHHFEIPYAYLRFINLSWDHAALEEAILQSGFSEIYYADFKWFNILSVYSKFSVVVYGRT